MSSVTSRTTPMVEREVWQAWPVYWTPVWIGALTSLAVALIFGLIGIAIGAHKIGTDAQILKWAQVSRGAVVWSILGSFLSFAVGGWAAASVAGIRRAEPAMLHGAISWLVALPLLIIMVGIGSGNAFGGWYGGLVSAPAWGAHGLPADPNAAIASRNAALASVTAILLGLMGSVIGGWMGSGQPMTLAAPARGACIPD